MKTRLYLFCLFIGIYFIYFVVATQFTFIPKWALDYFNQMAESPMYFRSGWMQFGYRYSLDITVLLIILSLYGIKGRINILYCLGVIFSVVISMIGINALF